MQFLRDDQGKSQVDTVNYLLSKQDSAVGLFLSVGVNLSNNIIGSTDDEGGYP